MSAEGEGVERWSEMVVRDHGDIILECRCSPHGTERPAVACATSRSEYCPWCWAGCSLVASVLFSGEALSALWKKNSTSNVKIEKR